MVISDNTKEIIKNFYGINQGVVFRVGKKQTTISTDERMLAEAELDIDIPVELGIYDLSKFLGNLNSLTTPEIDFRENHAVLSDQDTEINYYGCKPSLIFHPESSTNLVLEKVSFQFKLTSTILSKVMKIASINGSNQIVFRRELNKLNLYVQNSEDKSAVSAKIFLQDDEGPAAELAFDVDVISKLLPSTYTVKLDSEDHSIGLFISDDMKIQYYISASIEV